MEQWRGLHGPALDVMFLQEHRTDRLSACYRNRDGSYAKEFTSRYSEICAHLGVVATCNNRGVAHENGTNRCAEVFS